MLDIMPVFVIFRLLMIFFGKTGNGISDLPAIHQSMFYLISIIRYGAFFYGLVQLRILFGLYEKEMFFVKENVVCFQGVAWALIAAAVMNLDLTVVLLADPGFVITYHANNPIMYSIVSSIFLFCNLLPGFLLLLISWTMDEGRFIKEDQEQFI